MVERFIIDDRHRVCAACSEIRTCKAAPSIFKEQSDCPKNLHPPRHEVIAARAWPADKPAISGCCDRAD